MPENHIKKPDPSTTNPNQRWFVLLAVAIFGVALDQVTKRIADAKLKPVGTIELVNGFFELRYSRNPGAFFSMGASMPSGVRRGFFVLTTIIAVGLMLHLYRKALPEQRALRWALIVLVTGAIGNLIDRALYGDVIDFLHMHWHDVFHWATFNVADIFISAGLGFLILDMVQSSRTTKPADSSRPTGR